MDITLKIVLLFYVDDCLMISNYKDKFYAVYLYLRTDIKIEDYGDLNKYLDIYLERFPYGSIYP